MLLCSLIVLAEIIQFTLKIMERKTLNKNCNIVMFDRG